MARRVPQRAFGIGQLSTLSVQYIERIAEQCETVTVSEALRTSETRNSHHASSNDSDGGLELIEAWGHPRSENNKKQARGINLWPAKMLGRGGWI